MIGFLLMASAASATVPVTREPLVPRQWEQSVEFSCAGDTLRIVGYGPTGRNGAEAQVLLNGQPLEGAGADALRKDLSNSRAAYRLYARCPQGRQGIGLAIYTGEKEGDEITYRSGAVLLTSNHLDDYRGLDRIDSDSFWFK